MQPGFLRQAPLPPGPQDFAEGTDRFLRLPDHEKIHEVGQGLRVHQDGRASGQDQGISLPSVFFQKGDSGQVHHREEMGVIIFIRDGKGQNVEGSDRLLRFEGKEGGIGSAVFRDILRVGKKNPLAGRTRLLIEEPIDRLEPQVGHGRVIAVGIGQGDGKAPSPVLEIGEGQEGMLLGKEAAGFFEKPSGHMDSLQRSAISDQETVFSVFR